MIIISTIVVILDILAIIIITLFILTIVMILIKQILITIFTLNSIYKYAIKKNTHLTEGRFLTFSSTCAFLFRWENPESLGLSWQQSWGGIARSRRDLAIP